MNFPPRSTLLISFLLLAGIAWLDIYSSDELRITSLYLIPILLVTWNNGRKWGYAFSAVAFMILIAIDSMSNASPNKHLYFDIDTAGHLISYLIVIALATKLRTAYDRERQLARTDTLTHLMNRHAFYDALEVEMARSTRHAQPFSLLYLDCDNFKQINDTMGHWEGDQLLRLIGDVLRRNVRKGDFVARLGGDEFAIFFADTNGTDIVPIAADLTQKLKGTVTQRYPQVSFSSGIAIFLNTPPSLDEVIMRADELMYRVKSTGKNGLLQQTF
jgi:diguanylate cyclase (GGDEF)-like protein